LWYGGGLVANEELFHVLNFLLLFCLQVEFVEEAPVGDYVDALEPLMLKCQLHFYALQTLTHLKQALCGPYEKWALVWI